MAESDKSPIKIFGNDALSTRVATFQKKADESYKKKKFNPFSKLPVEGESLAAETNEIEVMAESDKSPVKIFGNDALSTRVAAFQKKADEPYKKKKVNPFSKLPVEGESLAAETNEVDIMADSSKTPIKIYGNDALASRVASFQKKANEHYKKQKANPFSAVGGTKLDHPKWDKNDPRYGRPVEGSKTELRGKAAGTHIGNEVQYLCSIISEFGIPCEDGTTVISFGELFEIYCRISNKVVGILLRARKHGLLHFEGEILFQRRDDDVIITLLRPITELREEWGVKAPCSS